MSADEIGTKVYLVSFLAGPKWSHFQDILPYGRETRSDSWPSCHVWLRIFPAEGMAYLSL